MRSILILLALCAGCGEGDPIYVYLGGADTGTRTRDVDSGVVEPPTGLDLTTAGKIEAFLDGKTLLMTGDDIPTHPNGFLEDLNLGQATQCYNRVELTILGGTWTTRSALGTLNDAPETNDVGTCDRDTPTTNLEFPSTAILINNVEGNADCFDVTATYAGFSQEGRGSINADGSVVRLEFYFKDLAIGHRCADGDVGQANTVTVNEVPFTGDAVQVYRVSGQ